MEACYILEILLAISMAFVCVESRQMCVTCQFQSAIVEAFPTAKDKECINAPYNWTAGVVRMRCPNRCTIRIHYDSQTMIPTYFFRGCESSTRENGCIDMGVFWDCFHSCGGGEDSNYCNDVTDFKFKDGALVKEDEDKITDEDNKGKDDMAASLYALVGLIGVCALGYYVKKNCCGGSEEEGEEGVEGGVGS